MRWPAEDLMPTVELLHHISMRDTFAYAHPTRAKSKIRDIAIKLFGINPIFGMQPIPANHFLKNLMVMELCLSKTLSLLDLETQEYLAEFIKYGYYRIFKSNQQMASSVRIICSTNQNLQTGPRRVI